MAICWLLNVAQLGVGWLLLVADVRMLPAYYVLIGAIGLVQVGYVVPIWRPAAANRQAADRSRDDDCRRDHSVLKLRDRSAHLPDEVR